ncbi:MAG: Asp-tRNA(Asn)/Glu-tRNA(Gln) amidotransferase subunit GatB [Coriobacteriia bacterium]|nr:Asp-tRNA(Asn)/Glu-tRNA(Gln) amidotransferase subunit GatB [Coriobacteriia bacterium]
MAKDRLQEVLVDWEAVIGLEIHTELTACATKMFCGCPVEFAGEPNTRVCPVCLGMPGALPVPNERAIELTVLAGLATGCEIARWSQFHRKQYFYPDMPKDYQISQYDLPFCGEGHIDIAVDGPGVAQRLDREVAGNVSVLDESSGAYSARIGITRIHLEEDTGKMIHVGGAEGRLAGATHSLVDFNRAGTPLIELVSEPDIRTPEEARRFAQQLRLTWLTLGISDCNMEEGSMRVDANVSVRRRGETGLGVKAEIKNMNSFKSLHDGVAYEIVRQVELLESGGRVVQETRHWDVGAKRTSALRSKEEAHDYRYFPEPDMVPFEFSEAWIDGLRNSLPELPADRYERYCRDFGLSPYDAGVLVGDIDLAGFFEAALAEAGSGRAKAVANIVINDLTASLNATGAAVVDSPVAPGMVAELVGLVDGGTISSKQAKEVFAEMTATGEAPAAIVVRKGMKQVSDSSAIEEVVVRVLAAHPDEVAGYRGGKVGLLGFFVGQVMREMRGQANPAIVNEVLLRELDRT